MASSVTYDRAIVAGAGVVRGETEQSILRRMAPRLAHLQPRDRVLLELVPTGQRSIREVSRMLGVNPGALSRRFRSVSGRMQDPLVAMLLDPCCALPKEHRQVGLAYFLTGLSAKAIARKYQMQRDSVRKIVSFLRGYARGAASRIGRVG